MKGWLGPFLCLSDPLSLLTCSRPWGLASMEPITGPNSPDCWLGLANGSPAWHGDRTGTYFPGSLPAGPPCASGCLHKGSQVPWQHPMGHSPSYLWLPISAPSSHLSQSQEGLGLGTAMTSPEVRHCP